MRSIRHKERLAAIRTWQAWRLGLAALALALPWLFGFTYGPAHNMLPLLFACGAAGIFILLSPQRALSWRATVGLCALPAVLLVHSALTQAPWPQMTVAAAGALWLFYLLVRSTQGWQATAPRLVHYLMLALVAAAVLSAGIALAQYFEWADGLSPWIHPGNASRVFANLRQPNQLATLTAIGWAGLICLNLPPPWPRRQRIGWGRTVLLLLAFAAQLLALALLAFAAAASLSRTGLLAWVLIYGVFCYWAWRGLLPKRAWVWATLALFLYGGFSLVLTQGGFSPDATAAAQVDAFERLASTNKADARLLIWQHVLDAMAAKPWLGWGWGNLSYALLLTPHSAPLGVMVDNAHNLPLHLAAELGLPLAVLFVLAVLVWGLRRQPWAESQPLRQAALLILLAIGLHSLLEYPLWHGPFLLAAAFAVGLLQKPVLRVHATRLSSSIARLGMALSWLTGLAALLFAFYAAQDWRLLSQVYLEPEQRDTALVRKGDWLADSLDSNLFTPHAEFARMGITPLSAENAAAELARAQRLLYFSAETRVLQRAQQAAALLGLRDWEAYYTQLLQKNKYPDQAVTQPKQKK